MKLYLLGQSHANAALAHGLRLDGTDKIESFSDFLIDTFYYADYRIIQRKSAVLTKIKFLKEVGFQAIPTETHDEDFNMSEEFVKLFPKFIETSSRDFEKYINSLSVAVTSDGDIILADLGIENTGSFITRAFEALCEHSGVQVALESPLWKHLNNNVYSY